MHNIKAKNKSNEKKEHSNENTMNKNNSLSLNESLLLNKILEEYNDLFPEIMHLKKEDFLSSFQNYIQIYFASKNILFSIDILNKIMNIIINEYYLKEKDKIDELIKSLNNNQLFIDEKNKNYIPHCYNTNEPIHICGKKFYNLNNGEYFYCLKCNKVYQYKSVLLFCKYCNKDYYSEIKENYNIINKNKIDYKLKPATWVKYHCNVSMNDTMKCPKCNNNFYLNMKNRLVCIKCNYDIDQFDIKWICEICGLEFISEAKEYNPSVFKIIRLSAKKAIFNNIEAKPPFVPCCNISEKDLNNLKFIHKKECNGILYEGLLDNNKIVVCLKCNMLNYYDKHYWMCPLCKNKYNLRHYEKNYDYSYENDETDENYKKEKKKYYQTEKYKKKYKKYINSSSNNEFIKPKILKKKYNNYEKYKNQEPHSYRNYERKMENIDEDNLPIKKYKSNNIYNNTDERINNNFIEYNKSKYENNNNKNKEISLYNHIKNKSLNGIKNIKYYPSDYNKEINELNKNSKDYKYQRKKPKLYVNPEFSEFNSDINYIKTNYINSNNNENRNTNTNIINNNSSKFLRMININKKENIQNYILKNNYYSNKNNNIKSLNNINNNLSNININLNVNVNINNSQKEKILKNIYSYNDIQKKMNLSKENNKKLVSYRNHLKNLSIDLSNNIPTKTLNNFDIDDYNIIKSIGEGTFGKIYEVEDKYHRHFAMKKLICNSIKEIDILKKEYEFLYNFEDLNINLIKIYGIEIKKLDKTTFVMYVLMELAKIDWEKEIMHRKKTNNFYSEKELIFILKDLITTLSKLQQNNISHRDIKPQNILLCDNNILKISDFGEAKKNFNNDDNDTITQTIRGTELYMSPALFRSLKQKIKSKYIKHNTYKSDVYSLGYCILLAATLNFDCLYSIREIHDMNLIEKKIKNYLKNRYSDYFLNLIFIMINNDEKNRPDFLQLEKIIKNIGVNLLYA